MKFISLTLENYSSYFKKHTITFETNDEKPVTIIIGGGGFGKTSIFDAINWALYGKQYEQTLLNDVEKSIIDYVNETALLNARISGKAVEMACTLIFEHDEFKYRIQQALCVKYINNKIQITDQMSTLYKVHPNGNSQQIFNIDSFLNEILPNNVRDYFLFNGDRINKLSLPGSSEQIRDGIYRVVDLELLQNGARHLEEVAKKFRRSAKQHSVGEVANVEEKYSKAYEEYDSLKDKQVISTNEKIALENKIEIIQAKLREMDGVKELQRKRDVLNERYTSNLNKQKNLIQDIRATAALAILEYSIPSIDSLRDILNQKREKGEIPSSISEGLLKDILEMKRCICGSEFCDGDTLHQELTRRLYLETEKKKKGHDLLDLYFELGTAKSEIERAVEKLPKIEQERSNIDQKLLEINKELGVTLEKLKNQPEEEISKLAIALSEYNNDLTEVKIELNRLAYKIEQKDLEIKALLKQREELGAKQVQVRKYQLRDNLAQSSADLLEKIFAEFAEESRLEVQELTRQEFVKFMPNVSALTVGINAEFHYDVLDQNGEPALQQLSMGQKQALSLAYITSISRVSEKNPPLVIDMPFGRLDEDVQMNVALRLPALASQVILLVLPGTEWNERTKEIFYNKSSNIYELQFDPALRQTTIEKVK